MTESELRFLNCNSGLSTAMNVLPFTLGCEKIPWSGSVTVYMDALLNISPPLPVFTGRQKAQHGFGERSSLGNDFQIKLSKSMVFLGVCIKRSFPSTQIMVPAACFPKLVEPFSGRWERESVLESTELSPFLKVGLLCFLFLLLF